MTNQLLSETLEAAQAIADRLRRSQNALGGLFPLDQSALHTLGEAEQDQIDAFLKRYEQLQDTLSNNLGRLILETLGEDVKRLSARAAFDRMGSLGILKDPDLFFDITKLRHRLTHEYPKIDLQKQARRLNQAWSTAPHLLIEFDTMTAFVIANLKDRETP